MSPRRSVAAVCASATAVSFRTVSLSRHALTNIDVIRDFVDVRIAVVDESRDVVRGRDVVAADVSKVSVHVNKIVVFGEHEPRTLAQLEDVASRAERAALMADGHVGYVMPIGGVAAYREQVSVVGVGFDIACGNAAIRTDLTLAGSPRPASTGSARSPTRSRTSISFGIGRKNRADDAPVDHPLFETPAWDARAGPRARRAARQGARSSSAPSAAATTTSTSSPTRPTRIWVGVHFGSRGFGHTSRPASSRSSQGEKWGARVPEREVLLVARQADGARLLGADDARRRVRLRRPRVGGAQGGLAPRRPRAGAGAQPPQLRVARGARRRRGDRRPQGRDAGVSRVRRASSAARWATTR